MISLMTANLELIAAVQSWSFPKIVILIPYL